MKAPKGIMRHSNNAGNLVKDINRLMKVKYELNEIMEISDRLCNADALCDGSCNLVLEELSEYYDSTISFVCFWWWGQEEEMTVQNANGIRILLYRHIQHCCIGMTSSVDTIISRT